MQVKYMKYNYIISASLSGRYIPSKSLELPEGYLAKDRVSKRLENWSWERLGTDVGQLELGTYGAQLYHPFTSAFLKVADADGNVLLAFTEYRGNAHLDASLIVDVRWCRRQTEPIEVLQNSPDVCQFTASFASFIILGGGR